MLESSFFVNKEELKESREVLLNHCYDMGILKRTAFEKKKEAILDSLIISVIRAELSIDEVLILW